MRGRLGIYLRLLGYLRPYWPQLLMAYGAMGIATLLNLTVPQIIKRAIDTGLAQDSARPLFVAAALILAIAFGRGLVAFAHRFYGDWLTHRVAFDLRNGFYASVQS